MDQTFTKSSTLLEISLLETHRIVSRLSTEHFSSATNRLEFTISFSSQTFTLFSWSSSSIPFISVHSSNFLTSSGLISFFQLPMIPFLMKVNSGSSLGMSYLTITSLMNSSPLMAGLFFILSKLKWFVNFFNCLSEMGFSRNLAVFLITSGKFWKGNGIWFQPNQTTRYINYVILLTHLNKIK